MAKPTIKLWSVQLGKLRDFEVRIENSEVVAEQPDTGETIKFTGGLSKDKLMELVDAHNKANKGVVARSEEDLQAEKELDEANEQLLKDLA